jgi:hypothetical protein
MCDLMRTREYTLAETTELATELRLRWKREGVNFRDPATEAEISAFERAHALRLPDDVRAYLTVVNGMTDWEWDEELLEFMSLQRMAEGLLKDPIDPRSVVLVDYSLSARVYVTRAGSARAHSAPIYPVGERSSERLFESFTQLLDVHLHDRHGVVAR